METEETDPEKIAELAMEQHSVSASLCHQCSGRNGLSIGDAWDPVMNSGKPEVYKLSD